MKERIFSGQTLTVTVKPSTLEGVGRIMAEPGQGEFQKPQPQQGGVAVAERQSGIEPLPRRQQSAEHAWQEHYRQQGKNPGSLPFDEQQTVRLAIEQGLPPLGGGATNIDLTGITHPTLQRVVERINAANEAIAPGANRNDLDTLRRGIATITDLTAGPGEPPIPEGQRLTIMRRIGEIIQVAEPAEMARRRGAGIEEVTLKEDDVSKRFADLGFDRAAFANPTLQRVIDEVLAELRSPGGLTAEFIREKMAEARPIAGAGPFEEEGQKLQEALYAFQEAISAKRETVDEQRNLYGEIRLRPEQQIELINLVIDPRNDEKNLAAYDPRIKEKNDQEIDEWFNKLFGQADVNQNADWQAAIGPGGDLEVRDFINALVQASRRRKSPVGELTNREVELIDEKVRQLQLMLDLRKDLHTVAFVINSNLGIPDLRKFLKHFQANFQDAAFNIKGVTQILHLYEDAMHQVATENGGYITYEDMVNTVRGKPSKVETIVKKQAGEAKRMRMPVFKDMKEYEIWRAISIARGMGIVMGNFFEIVAEKGMSKGVPLTSWWANPIIKRMAPFRQFIRFRQGGKNLTALAFDLDEDKKGKFWTISKQKHLMETGLIDLLKGAVGNNKNVLKYVQSINPLDIGSMWSQTAWRWAQDEEHFNGAMSRLLEHNLINPLIGTGLWVEKHKGYLKSTKKLGKVVPIPRGMIDAVNIAFGHLPGYVTVTENTTEGDLAKLLIEQNLRLSINITPLTLFNSLTELRYAVLRNPEYVRAGQIKDPGGEDPSVMDGSDLQKDMNMLALLQEKLLDTRLNAYETWQAGGRLARMPNLYTEHADISRVIGEEFIEGHLGMDQRDRLLALVHNIQHEFTTGHLTGLMEDLKDKKWKVPYILGHDMPYDRIDFIKNGPDSVDRRGDDWEIVDATVPLINEYIENLSAVHKKEDLIAGLTKIHRQLSGHDRSVADELVKNLAEGTMLWFRKDIRAMMPAGFGTMWGLRGDSSLAEVAGGREKMAWDRSEMDEFVNMLHGANIMDTVSEGQIEELRKHTGSERKLVYFGLGGVAQTVLSFMVLAYLFYMFKKQIEEK